MNWQRRCRLATARLLAAAEAGRWVALDLVLATGMKREVLAMLLALPAPIRPVEFVGEDGSFVCLPAPLILLRLERAKQIELEGRDRVSGLTERQLAELFARAGEAGRRLSGVA
jgi:hypothetical protein